MRDQLIQKLIAAGYDAEELEQMNDLDLRNEVTRLEGNSPEDAISKQKPDPRKDQQRYNDLQEQLLTIGRAKMSPEDLAWLDNKDDTGYNGPRISDPTFAMSEDRQRANEAMNKLAIRGASHTTGAGLTGLTTGVTAQDVADGKYGYTPQANYTPPSDTKVNKEVWKTGGSGISKPKIDGSNRYRMEGIWDAWHNNKFGDPDSEEAKNTRNYLAIDAIAKGLRGIGKDISNVGAAYTGGAIQDSTPEESLWQKRNEEMMKSGIESEKATVSGSREQRAYDQWAAEQLMREYNNMSANQRIRMAEIVQEYAKNAKTDVARLKYMDLANKMLSGNTVSNQDLAITGIGEILDKIRGSAM